MAGQFEWQSSESRIVCRANGVVVFDDTLDHWQNALCRLMNLDNSSARQWVETVVCTANERSQRSWPDCTPCQKEERLKLGSREFFGFAEQTQDWDPAPFASISVLGERPNRIWASGIGADTTAAVIGNDRLQHGVLVTTAGGAPRLSSPLVYEEQYFEGEVDGLGYGKYLEQYDWRMEKSRRLVRQIQGVAYYLGRPADEGTRLLDVGSGYGYFRKAASEHRWEHDGLDVSQHAALTAEKLFGFSTNVATLEEFSVQTAVRYDVITLFDMVEHVEDPQHLIVCAADLLADGGLCVFRTPNILALELEVFGPYYHSLKREHIHYFSAKSLCQCLQSAGLTPVFMTTESHLLQGFLGRELATYARLLRGSDILAMAQKEVAARP